MKETLSIETALGIIYVTPPENLKVKMFLDSLKDQIEVGNLDNIIGFIDGGCSGGLKEKIKELEEEVESLKEELSDAEDKVSGLETDIDDAMPDSEIDGGLGVIEYNAPTNLQLQIMMENLNEAVKKHSPNKVNELLETLL